MIVIICESFNHYDACVHENDFLEMGFQVFDLDLAPSGNSGTTFVCMDSDAPWDASAAGRNPWTPAFQRRVPAIGTKDIWISNFVDTKIFTPAWPDKWNITDLDPNHRSGDSCTMSGPFEPDVPIFGRFLKFLDREFYASDYQRAIYWSLIGHIKSRVGDENREIPPDLRRTFATWAGLIKREILPRLELARTIILIHPDHGTRRRDQSYKESIEDGWLWLYHPEYTTGARHSRRVTWADYRCTLQDIFGLREKFLHNDGISILPRRGSAFDPT